MISNEGFVLSLGVLLGVMVLWACKRLPNERWQFLASVPILKDNSGRWHGLNFTYYGLLTANALVFGVALLIILFSAVHVPTTVTLAVIIAVLAVCLPAAKWVARLVEGKQCTFTIAGAFFVGIFVAPAIIHLFNAQFSKFGFPEVPMIPALAAIMIAYAFGEGLGRLACISFGCCYGVALGEAHPLLRRLFSSWHFVFYGETKKIAYASGMDGKQVLPIQALTAVLYIVTGLLATWLFLRADFAVAFILSVTITQGWRSISETLRADFRGSGQLSAYQVMGVLAIIFSVALNHLAGSEFVTRPDLAAGVDAFWQPTVLLLLQSLWALVFIMFGKSMVTGAQISFHLHHDRI